jgi:hypothetical protein
MTHLPRIRHDAGSIACPCHPLLVNAAGCWQAQNGRLVQLPMPYAVAMPIMNHQDEIGAYLGLIPGMIQWQASSPTAQN